MPGYGYFRRSRAISLSLLETENTFGTSTLNMVTVQPFFSRASISYEGT